jgi:hypothetical protein
MLLVGVYPPATAIWTSTNRLFTQTRAYYKTPADCAASIAGVYSQLQTVYNRNYWKQSY